MVSGVVDMLSLFVTHSFSISNLKCSFTPRSWLLVDDLFSFLNCFRDERTKRNKEALHSMVLSLVVGVFSMDFIQCENKSNTNLATAYIILKMTDKSEHWMRHAHPHVSRLIASLNGILTIEIPTRIVSQIKHENEKFSLCNCSKYSCTMRREDFLFIVYARINSDYYVPITTRNSFSSKHFLVFLRRGGGICTV